MVQESAIYQETINLQAHIKKEYSVLGPVCIQEPSIYIVDNMSWLFSFYKVQMEMF